MQQRWLGRAFGGLTAVAVLGAVLSQATGWSPPYWVGWALGFLCVVVAALLVVRELAVSINLLWPRVLGVIALVSTFEIVGLYTGWPFGHYQYTHLWLPLLPLPEGQRFPIALPLAWFILVGAVVLFLGQGRWVPFLGGALLALIDFGLEPVLTGPVSFWHWQDGSPPPINYLGWFVVGSVACWLLKLPSSSPAPSFTRSENGIQSRKSKIENRKSNSLAFNLLTAVLSGTVVIGLAYGEPRGLYALVPLLSLVGLRFWLKPPP